MAKNLVIVESPAKASTIEKYLGKDFIVKSSYGHVRDLAHKGLAIDIENQFTPSYEVSDDKRKVVSELNSLSKKVDTVWLATDEDREGEAISWHLFETLKLKKENTRRITFNEITKPAILKAIESPRDIDYDLVDAQQARRVLDRIVGFELSPVLWKKVRPSLSAGRVQSVTVRLVVEKEKEIESFTTENYYRLVAFFDVNGKELKAEITKKLSEDVAKSFLEDAKEATFVVSSLDVKPAKKQPTAPFTTSTLQQEASRKLGMSPGITMRVAQSLYESGKITYMRTDSTNLSDEALKGAKNEIHSAYGEAFHKQRKYVSKNKGAQEAHEAIRPTDFSVHSFGGGRDEVRLYELIWKRAIASQMSDAQLERTTVHIDNDKNNTELISKGEVLKFEGFLKVYLESTDDENEDETQGVLPKTTEGEVLNLSNMKATERFTHHPARYTEASLVRKLEELGIGRPSTYAPTVSTIQKRGYVVREDREGKERSYKVMMLEGKELGEVMKTEISGAEKKKLFPTDIGIVVNDFLIDHFKEVMDYGFTASVEKEFDDIAQGQLKWNSMIDKFYKTFHAEVEDTLENAERASGERHLGVDPESGKDVLVRIGRFGPMAQIGKQDDEEKPRFASLQKDQHLTSITLEEALELFKFPKVLGEYEGFEITVAQGRFGPYVKFDKMFVSIPKEEELGTVTLDRAVELIQAKQKADAPVDEYEGMPVQKGTGRFGPFIKWNDMFINVNKKYDFDNLSHNDIVELIEAKKQKEIDKYIHRWDDEGISVQKARWGRFNIVKGKFKIELAKTFDVESLTLEKVKEMLEEKMPKKKTKKK